MVERASRAGTSPSRATSARAPELRARSLAAAGRVAPKGRRGPRRFRSARRAEPARQRQPLVLVGRARAAVEPLAGTNAGAELQPEDGLAVLDAEGHVV